MKKKLITLIIIFLLVSSLYFLINFSKRNEKLNKLNLIPVVRGEDISFYYPKENKFDYLGKGDIIFKSIKNGKYLLCGEGEPLFIPDGIGYYTGYNLYLIDTETKEKIHLLGYENAKLERIQFGKSVKEVKDGGDIVSLIVHPDENRVFYVDKNCALWEFKIENKEKKRLTEDYRVVPRFIAVNNKGEKIFYSYYPENVKQDLNFQDGVSIEVLDLISYERKIFKKAEKNDLIFCDGAEYGVIGIGDDEFMYIELGLDAYMTELLGKGKNRSWSGLLISKLNKFEVVKEYPYPYGDEITDIKLGFPITDFMEINGYCYILGREQKDIYENNNFKESYQNLILAKFLGSELIESKVLKDKLFLGFKARFTFDGNIAYEVKPDEWVIIDLDGKEILKFPKGIKPY